ncbi:hypothetical protein IPG41_03680 [Candidatus Peregrinibacteria bacterium]|nr:MAG: hypothetical protein IPG41_03680 [Candidatus Peregrinibacteria bacterium]
MSLDTPNDTSVPSFDDLKKLDGYLVSCARAYHSGSGEWERLEAQPRDYGIVRVDRKGGVVVDSPNDIIFVYPANFVARDVRVEEDPSLYRKVIGEKLTEQPFGADVKGVTWTELSFPVPSGGLTRDIRQLVRVKDGLRVSVDRTGAFGSIYKPGSGTVVEITDQIKDRAAASSFADKQYPLPPEPSQKA